MWIPSDSDEIKLKLLVLSHCGALGHRGKTTTESVLREYFVWDGMADHVATFVSSCLHCIITRTGEVVPRPIGHALQDDKPNEVIHTHYLFLGDNNSKLKYLLLIGDDLASYVRLWPTETPTSDSAAEALATWIAVYGSMVQVLCDQGSHFKNQLVKNLTAERKVGHHFTTAYCPWANVSGERVCREVLRACEALLHEFRLALKDLPSITECIQSVINQSPFTRLGRRIGSSSGVYRTPLEVFTSHRPTCSLPRALPIEG